MDPSDLSTSPSGRSCPAIGVRKERIRFRLQPRSGTVEASSGGGADPLVRSFSGVTSYRSYLASVEANGQDLIPFVTILLEPNEYPGVRAALSQPGASNAQIERTWGQAFQDLRAVSPDGLAALETRSVARDAPPAMAPRSGPLAFCRKMEEYIEPLCPACLGLLSVCRDETLLRTSGLPPYATTLSRYLYCRSCAAGAGWAPTFYTYSLRDSETAAPGVRVRRRSELYRDLATAIQVGTGTPEGEHFCFECPNRTICYPSGRSVDDPVPAEDLLFPLSYYENLYLPVEPWPFDFATAAALLGGASAEAALNLSPAGENSGDAVQSAQMERLSKAGGQFFFEGDSSGLFGLEVLNLKLSAFAGLVRGLKDLAVHTGRPHLALGPDRVRGRLTATGAGFLPARWGLTLGVGDLLTTAPLELFEPIAGEPRVWSIPWPIAESFVPDGLTRIQSESLFMRLNVRELTIEDGPDGPMAHLVAELSGDGYRDSDHGRLDLVRLSTESAPGFDGRLVFAGRKISTLPRGFLFEGRGPARSPGAARPLDPRAVPASWSVEVTIVHTFWAPADVMSLGALLLKLLLANDSQDGSQLNRETAERLAGVVARGGAPDDSSKRLEEAFRHESLESGPEQVLYREADRHAGHPAIPAMLWDETLELALRMASNIPGWSVCAAQDDYDPERPARAFDRVLEELQMLLERARGGLIGSSGRNGVILEVCDDFLDDFRDAASAGVGSGEDAPQMTIVAVPPRRAG